MNGMNRREFVKTSAWAGVAALGVTGARALNLPEPPRAAVLNLSCQLGVAPGRDNREKLDFIEATGFTAVEVGGGWLEKNAEAFRKDLEGRKLRVSALCAGFAGVPVSDDPAVRQTAKDSIKRILAAAGAFKSVGMIMVPAFNGQTKLSHWECRELLVKDILPELGDHAKQAGTRVILEPLNRGESQFLRQVADAAAICRDVKNAGVGVMGDFWHMTREEPSDFAAFVSAGADLVHVHIASRKTRKIPGEDAGDNYVDGFRGLKFIGYTGDVSLECGHKGDPKVSLPAAVKLMKEQWDQA